jgi:hypothetical protein
MGIGAPWELELPPRFALARSPLSRRVARTTAHHCFGFHGESQ